MTTQLPCENPNCQPDDTAHYWKRVLPKAERDELRNYLSRRFVIPLCWDQTDRAHEGVTGGSS